MLYRKSNTIDLAHYSDTFGQTAGSVGRAAISAAYAANPLVGLALSAGHLAGKAIPKDKYGIAKTGVTAAASSLLDPTSTWDNGIRNFQEGDIGEGIASFIPGLGGIVQRKDELEELDKARADAHKETKVVGGYNNLAGKLTGQSTGVDTILQDDKILEVNNRGVNAADVVEFAQSAYAAKDQIKTGFDKTKSLFNDNQNVADAVDINTDGVSNVNIKDPTGQSIISDVLGGTSDVLDPLDINSINKTNLNLNNNGFIGPPNAARKIDMNDVTEFAYSKDQSGIPRSNINPNGTFTSMDIEPSNSFNMWQSNKSFNSESIYDQSGLPFPVNPNGIPMMQGLEDSRSFQPFASNSIQKERKAKIDDLVKQGLLRNKNQYIGL